ncbi:AAA family ATPase [Isoptericola sp. NEAU-Y5]|uniref:AAA family ATPase n=1 Tax=Isoptericola luteus TaxID=2879484 RepID=A0ABS7ZGU2_9MICO|nr:AAA family ATPase [Isoptericola sp. NEAU-Y5]MCA5894236.1 AAA family ATPase [Isoptericola sp. NEAU-Y5]
MPQPVVPVPTANTTNPTATTSTTTTPTAATDAARDAVEEEQATLDAAWRRRAELLDTLEATLADARPADATAHARAARLRGRRAELLHADQGLVFGRVDGDDGSVRHLGRAGLPGATEDDEPLVVDWRAPVARPFYTATPVDPQGLRRRRHVRTRGREVVGVDDEPLDAGLDDSSLVGEGALLAALDERRTGRMGTAVATLQREQDDVVRADARTPLVVQGGPGTGKTVVALHRVAYLLFAHPHLAERGVLVLGPSRRFLDYIAQVLPALGETAVVSATCDTLVPGVRPTRGEERDVAEIKGRSLWLPVLRRFVASLEPAGSPLDLVLDGEEYELGPAQVAAARRAAEGAGAYHRARERVVERVHDLLTDAVADRQAELLARAEDGFEDVLGRLDATLAAADDRALPTGATGSDVDGVLSEADLEALRARIAADPGVAAAVDAWWPRRDAATELARLLRDGGLLRTHAPELTGEEIARVVAEPVLDGWSSSDVPLLDALADLLGAPGARHAAHADAHADANDDANDHAHGAELAERAARTRDWAYGHVVVDEAQELSGMQWHMVVRRCPTRSVTAVGDIDQASSAHRQTDWGEAVSDALGDRWRRRDLTLCYRTPREVMELTGPVLRRAGSRNDPPRAVRSAAVAPWRRSTDEAGCPALVAAAVAELVERYDGGTVGVVAPVARVATLREALPTGVPAMSATEAKGLEWDAAVVVDPDGIAAEPRGWNGLYVALTRCTQELGQVVVA